MFTIQLVDVEEVTVVPKVWWLISFADVLRVKGTDVVDGWSWSGHPGSR